MTDRTCYRQKILILTFSLLLGLAGPADALVISEIMYHPASTPGGDADESLEFLELYNDRAVSEDLGGYSFVDGITYTFPEETFLGPKQYLVVAREPNAMVDAYGLSGAYGPYTGRLGNADERIQLASKNGLIVLSVTYDDDAPWPVACDGTGHSLILSKQGGDPDEASTWARSTLIGGTPGHADAVQQEPEESVVVRLVDVGHPGRYFPGRSEPSPGPGDVPTTAWTEISFNDTPVVTSWREGPSGYGYSSDAAERQFIGTQLTDMPGNYISIYARLPFTLSREQVSSLSQLLAEVHYDDAYVLYLNGRRVADSGDMPDPVPYNQPGGQAWDPPVDRIDLTGRMTLLVPGTNVLAIQAHNATISGSSDCIASPVLWGTIDPAESADDPQARIVINEVLANSDAAPGTDWIELYNPGPIAVDLSNVYVSDDRQDLLKSKLPAGATLQPGEMLVLEEGAQTSGFAFALDFSGETVYLTVADGGAEPKAIRVLDAVRYGPMPPDVTWGRFPNGVDSFEFLDAATPGASNQASRVNDIVINEIMYQHAMRDDRYDYIELHNQGSSAVSLAGWAFTDGIDYEFRPGTTLRAGGHLVIAADPLFLAEIYAHLTVGADLIGPYSGRLADHSERVRLSYPMREADPQTGRMETYMVTADEVTYYDGGRWPHWANGQGASLELRDPGSNNNAPDAWAASDEIAKTTWRPFSFTIDAGDNHYRHDNVNIFDLMLLNRGEVLLDDLKLIVDGVNRISNGAFESGASNWRILGNHVRSFVTTEDRRSGAGALHLIATGHGDPGANRINQSISSVRANNVTFSGWARWLRGSRFLLLRASAERSPVQPPRPSHAFELEMPLDLGTPGRRNTAFVANRGPDILDVQHAPVMPAAGDPVVVTARIADNDGISSVRLLYRPDGSGSFTTRFMRDDGTDNDAVAGDAIYTAALPGGSRGTMWAFYIEASDGIATSRFPTRLQPSAEVPERTCLVRVDDTQVSTSFATYRVWMSSEVVNTFRSRPNLANELLDCTFVYNDSEVFYNCGIRHRGSPFLRNGSGRRPTPSDRHGFRIEFRADQKFRDRDEINLDGTEGGGRGPLQERACYWFYEKMGLQYSRQEYVRLIMNGDMRNVYEDVQKVDGDYVDRWFPDNSEGYLHKVDDYFEYNASGTSHRNYDEGLKHDSQHPLIPETYRWGFEKRSHREDDNWEHLFDFAAAMNMSAANTRYQETLESLMDPNHFAAVLAIRHAVGDWDSYGYERGKNNYFYYALPEGKWYLLPWDIDFCLGSGNGASTDLFRVTSGEFPEVKQFFDHPIYKRVYLKAYEKLVNGPWQTSYGTSDPPTPFDRFLDEAADALMAEGFGDGRRNQIKLFVRSRRTYILGQLQTALPEPQPGR